MTALTKVLDAPGRRLGGPLRRGRRRNALAMATHPLIALAVPLLKRLPGTRSYRVGDGGAALERAVAHLQTLDYYAEPLSTRRLEVIVAPALYRLPWLRDRYGCAVKDRILLEHAGGLEDRQLLAHELCHIWQIQQVGRLRMNLAYLREGYAGCGYELEAMRAAERMPR